jgi:hypothetical protein
MDQTMLAENIELYNSIFCERANLFQWGKYQEYARRQTLVEPELSSLWVAALQTFKSELGRKFLEQVKGIHPLTRWIRGIDRTSVLRLVQIANIIQYLKTTDPNYKSFRRRLQSPDWAKRETMALLVVGLLLRLVGLDIHIVPEKPPFQTPDFAMSDPASDQIIYGELSGLAPADELKGPAEDYEKVNALIRGTLTNHLFSADLLARIPLGYEEQLTLILQSLEAGVSETHEDATYTDEFLTITQFPIDQMAEFNAWMDKNNRRKGFHGIPQNYDYTERIGGNKIPDKGKQASVMGNGILFIPVPWQHFWHQRVSHTIARLEVRMSTFPRMFGTFLFSEIIHIDPQDFRFHADDAFLRRPLADGLTLYSLFVPNPAFIGSIDNRMLDKLLYALNTPDANLECRTAAAHAG